MPRRPRPATRRAPSYVATSASKSSASAAAVRRKSASGEPSPEQFQQDVSESESSSSRSRSQASEVDGGSEGSQSGSDLDEDLDEMDAEPDAPRVVQWVDEDTIEDLSDEESINGSDDEEEEVEEVDHDRLEADLKALPFGALRKAQKALAKVQADDSEEEASDYASESEAEFGSNSESVRDKGKAREEPRPKKEVPKRKHKHAPTELSSKRPVPRMKLATEPKPAPRDPRFLPITGEFDPKRFHTQYGFLAELHEQELKTLKENLKRARKLLANSPRDLREEREAEVQRLERAVKRAESLVNKDRQEKVQLEALSKVAKEEREKRQQGKKAWYMKDADKKALLLRAKYEALASEGGRGAVRKAIEKKQKKVSQKEKKRRPQVGGPPPRMNREAGPSRKRTHGGEGGPRKRSRTS